MNTKSIKKAFIFALLGIFISINAYSGTIPSAVTEAFAKKFPDALNVKWGKENATEYEASFKLNGVKYSANYSDKGEWLETETGTTFDKLPANVQEAYNKNYVGHKVKAAAVIETSKGDIKYEIEYIKGKKTTETFYDAKGNSVKED